MEPEMSSAAFLAFARFVLTPDLQLFAGMRVGDFLQLGRELS
jgi:hypothetical protein